MARWSDIAVWEGPTPNQSGSMVEQRGLVLHIMQGSYAGSISWGKNPVSSVSFHFATRADGHIGQLVDTDVTAWTQGNGNGHWISVENEGYSGNPLTAGQVEACAQLYARGVREYGWPLQTTDSPSGFGLGWHGMGGSAWGSHPDCPGQPIKDQRGAILARAEQILTGVEDDVSPEQNRILLNLANVIAGWSVGANEVNQTFGDGHVELVDIAGLYRATAALVSGGGGGNGPSAEQIADAVADEQAQRLIS